MKTWLKKAACQQKIKMSRKTRQNFENIIIKMITIIASTASTAAVEENDGVEADCLSRRHLVSAVSELFKKRAKELDIINKRSTLLLGLPLFYNQLSKSLLNVPQKLSKEEI